MANRHRGRIIAFQALYSWDVVVKDYEELVRFDWLDDEINEETLIFSRLLIAGFLENRETVDKIIQKNLIRWDLTRLNKVDLAILRLSTYSLLFQREISHRVIINEAIEIAKEFSPNESYKFINGVLDGIVKSII